MATAGAKKKRRAAGSKRGGELTRTRRMVTTLRDMKLLRRPHPIWLRLLVPAAILLLELMFVTPQFEFTVGPMVVVSNPVILTALLVGAATVLLLTSEALTQLSFDGPHRRPVVVMGWIGLHGGLFYAFFSFTTSLQQTQYAATTTWLSAATWTLLVTALALSAALTTLPAAWMARLVREYRGPLVVGCAVSAVMFVMTSVARATWTQVDGPALDLMGLMLWWYPGHEVIQVRPDQLPIVGTRTMMLVVTTHCSGMESLFAFLLMGGVVQAGRWRQMARRYFVAVLIVGFELLYLLNAVRIYLMVLLGVYAYPQVAVDAAHSQIGNVVFLLVSVAILLLGDRFARAARAQPAVA